MLSLSEIFGPTGHVGWAQECARAIATFAFAFMLVRLAGRRLFSRWGALDIVVSLTIGSNLSRALTGNAPLGGTFAATALLIALHWGLSQAAARSTAWSGFLEGKAVRLVEAEKPNIKKLRRHGVSDADLKEALRSAGVTDLSAARLLVLEPSGKISVLKGDVTGAPGE